MMEDDTHDILTDLLRSDIDKQEAIDKILMAIKRSKRVINKFKRSTSGRQFNKSATAR
jgi:hypothetical protein